MNREHEAQVLIVDDDPDILRFLEASLLRVGFRVVTTTTGEEALKIVRKKAPDLIVLDVMLPGMDGREVTQKLKKNIASKNIPIILVSAGAKSLHEQVLGLRDGADAYILKPFDIQELIRKIDELLAGRKPPETKQEDSAPSSPPPNPPQ